MTPEELHNIHRAEDAFWWYRGMRAITHALLDPLLEGRPSLGLDAGCGTGFNALDLERRYGVRMYGVDLARLAIDYCRERGFPRSAVASIMELPFDGNRFEMVTSFDVLSDLPPGEDEPILREFARILRPGGILLVRVPAFRSLRSRHSRYVAETHRYRSSELRHKIEALGFTIVRWTYANSFLSPIALLKFRLWENLWRSPAGSSVEKTPGSGVNTLLSTVLNIEAAMIQMGFRFPFGQSLFLVARKS